MSKNWYLRAGIKYLSAGNGYITGISAHKVSILPHRWGEYMPKMHSSHAKIGILLPFLLAANIKMFKAANLTKTKRVKKSSRHLFHPGFELSAKPSCHNIFAEC